MMKKPDAKKAPPSPPPEPGSRARRRHGTRYGPATACRTVVMYARTACAPTDRGRQAPSGQELLHGRVPAFPRGPDRAPRAFGRTSSGLKNSSIYQTICQVLPVISSSLRSWDTGSKNNARPARREARRAGVRAAGRQSAAVISVPVSIQNRFTHARSSAKLPVRTARVRCKDRRACSRAFQTSRRVPGPRTGPRDAGPDANGTSGVCPESIYGHGRKIIRSVSCFTAGRRSTPDVVPNKKGTRAHFEFQKGHKSEFHVIAWNCKVFPTARERISRCFYGQDRYARTGPGQAGIEIVNKL